MQTDDNQRMCQLKSVETETRNTMRLFQIKFCFVRVSNPTKWS